MNFDLPHSLVNRGGDDRVHLVVDGVADAGTADWFELATARA